MSLRRRLVVGALVLLVVAVVVTDVVTLSSLRSYLFGRLDEQADVAQAQAYDYIETVYHRAVTTGQRAAVDPPGPWLAQLAAPSALPSDVGNSAPTGVTPAPVSSDVAVPASGSFPRAARLDADILAARLSPDIYVEVLDAQGRVIFRRPSGSAENQDPAPVLPHHISVSAVPPVARFGTSHGPYLPSQPSFTEAARGQRGPYYLAQALAVPGGTLVTANAMAPSEQTLSSLTKVEVLVSVIVVLVMLFVALWTVRIGLRPLDDMTDTARAIAAGDMRRRIKDSDERGEVGKLGAALNGMLARIDAAMAQRTASESRLRRFVADASHELRTPLTSIRGYAELLRKGALDDDKARRRAAERIEHEATRMGVLVDDMLLLARLDQGRPLELARLDLSRVVADAVDAARAGDREHEVVLERAEPVWVMGDKERLRQVVDNLLGNAVVHTPAGTAVQVAVTSGQGVAQVAVADDGPGLSETDAAHVFDRFYRGELSRGRPGTGLGLSIVAALAGAHGGRARAGNRPSGGAEFVVELPLADVTETEPRVASAIAKSGPVGGVAKVEEPARN